MIINFFVATINLQNRREQSTKDRVGLDNFFQEIVMYVVFIVISTNEISNMVVFRRDFFQNRTKVVLTDPIQEFSKQLL